MSDPLTVQVRTVVVARMDSVSPERVARLRTHDYRPRRRRLSILPAIGTAAAAFVGAVAAAVLLLSTGTPAAFAGWTATPSPPTANGLATARRACGDVAATAVVAAEARGPYTAIAFTGGGKPWQCVVKGSQVVVKLSSRYPTDVYAPVPADKVMLPLITQHESGKAAARLQALQNRRNSLSEGDTNSAYKAYVKRSNALEALIDATMTGPDTVSVAIGLVGQGVTSVTFLLADGDQVHATVQHGLYIAWWPGAAKPGGGTAVRVSVTTPSGTRSSGVPAPPQMDVSYPIPGKGCVPGDSCSVFVPLELTPAIAPSVLSRFQMFRDTPAAKQASWPRTVRFLIWRSTDTGEFRGDTGLESREMRNGMSLGLDPEQVRSLKLGMHSTMWLIPGSEGFCTARVQKGGGGGSCGPADSLLRYGAVENPGSISTASGTRYFLGGFVPNGNATITVHLASGASVKVPVRHNAFTRSFGSPPESVTFKDGWGKTVTYPAPTPNEV